MMQLMNVQNEMIIVPISEIELVNLLSKKIMPMTAINKALVFSIRISDSYIWGKCVYERERERAGFKILSIILGDNKHKYI